MNANERNRFYLMWTLAIILCALVSLFLLIYTSFGGGSEKQTAQPAPSITESAEY